MERNTSYIALSPKYSITAHEMIPEWYYSQMERVDVVGDTSKQLFPEAKNQKS